MEAETAQVPQPAVRYRYTKDDGDHVLNQAVSHPALRYMKDDSNNASIQSLEFPNPQSVQRRDDDAPPIIPGEPGAWAFSNNNNNNNNNRSNNNNRTNNASAASIGMGRALQNSNAGLVEANMVLEDSVGNLPHATVANPNNTSSAEDIKEQKQKQQYLIGCTGLAVVLMVAVVLAVVLSTRSDNGSSDNFLKGEATTSAAPSFAPTQSPSDYVLSLVPESTSEAILRRPESPQSLAFQWLMEDPALQGAQVPTGAAYTDDRLLQRLYLAIFYFATGGPNWRIQQNWLSYEHPECQWYTHPVFIPPEFEAAVNAAGQFFYIADEIRAIFNPPCSGEGGADNNLTLKYLFLYQNDLVGTLPLEIFLLTSLEAINLAVNPQLEGTLPAQIGLLTKLQTLTFFGNPSMDGTLPTQIGLLSDSLLELVLIGTRLHGRLPSEILQLQNLQMLFLDSESETRAHEGPYLSGTIPTELGTMTTLKGLLLDGDFEGRIPTELGRLEDTLLYLGLMGSSRVTGLIPSQIGLLSRMDRMILRSTRLTGMIPSQLGRLNALVTLRLNRNALSGQVPTQLGLLTGCERINLEGNNQLEGFIPTSLCSLGPPDPSVDQSQNPDLGTYVSFDCSNGRSSNDTALLCGCSWCPCK